MEAYYAGYATVSRLAGGDLSQAIPCRSRYAGVLPWLTGGGRVGEAICLRNCAGCTSASDGGGAALCLPLLLALLFGLIDCADGGDVQQLALGRGEVEAPGNGVGFPPERLGDDAGGQGLTLRDWHPWGVPGQPVRYAGFGIAEVGELVAHHEGLFAAGVVIREHWAVAVVDVTLQIGSADLWRWSRLGISTAPTVTLADFAAFVGAHLVRIGGHRCSPSVLEIAGEVTVLDIDTGAALIGVDSDRLEAGGPEQLSGEDHNVSRSNVDFDFAL